MPDQPTAPVTNQVYNQPPGMSQNTISGTNNTSPSATKAVLSTIAAFIGSFIFFASLAGVSATIMLSLGIESLVLTAVLTLSIFVGPIIVATIVAFLTSRPRIDKQAKPDKTTLIVFGIILIMLLLVLAFFISPRSFN